MRRAAIATALACVAAVGISPRATAQLGDTTPVVQRVLAPAGEAEVNYFNDGVLTTETRIPADSVLNPAGSGGGEVQHPCYTFSWSKVEPNPTPLFDPVSSLPIDPEIRVEYSQDSRAWTYSEIVPTGVWTPERQGASDAFGGDGTPGGIDLTSAYSWGERYYALNAPLEAAMRRFEVHCGIVDGFPRGWGAWGPEGPLLGTVEVSVVDPFWNPLTRLDVLWGMIELEPFSVIAPPEVAAFGGLVVNMPTWLQIEASAWRPYFTAVDHYMGWYSQLGLFPSELAFEVVGAGGETVPCAPQNSWSCFR